MTIDLHTLSYTLNEDVGHLELCQPPSNEMSLDFFSELAQILEKIRHEKGLKALVISGRGRHFSSGARLHELLGQATSINGDLSPRMEKFLSENNRSFLILEDLPFPVISAIRGACLGSALELTLFTHFRFCGEDSVFGLPETTFNLIPGIGGISKTYKLAGKAAALELVLRGNTFSAEEALRLHLVDQVLPKKEVVRKAMEFARWVPSNYRKEKSKIYLQRFFTGIPVKLQNY